MAKQHRDIKGLRITFSVLLAIVATFCFSCFITCRAFKLAFSSNLIAESIANINILDMQMGDIVDFLNIDNVNPDSTVSELVATTISQTAAEQFDYNIPAESVEELLDDEAFRDDLNSLTQDVVGSFIEGELNGEILADDVEEIIVDNKDKIEEISGYEISDQLIDDIHDNIAKKNVTLDSTNNGQMDLGSYLGTVRDIIPDYVVYIFLGVGVACIMGILLMNMFKMATGVRTTGIVCIVVGILEIIPALAFKAAPALLVRATDSVLNARGMILRYYNGLFGDIINSYVTSIVLAIVKPALIFIAVGIVCMVIQGVLVSVSHKN